MWLIFPMDWGSELLICAIVVIAKAEVMQIYSAPSLMPSRELWVPPGVGFKHARVLLSSSAIPDFFLQMFKSWISFQRTRSWFRLISCKSQQHTGLNTRGKPIEAGLFHRKQVVSDLFNFSTHSACWPGKWHGSGSRSQALSCT